MHLILNLYLYLILNVLCGTASRFWAGPYGAAVAAFTPQTSHSWGGRARPCRARKCYKYLSFMPQILFSIVRTKNTQASSSLALSPTHPEHHQPLPAFCPRREGEARPPPRGQERRFSVLGRSPDRRGRGPLWWEGPRENRGKTDPVSGGTDKPLKAVTRSPRLSKMRTPPWVRDAVLRAGPCSATQPWWQGEDGPWPPASLSDELQTHPEHDLPPL